MEELILIVGPTGAGKATAITTIADEPAVSTQALHCGRVELSAGRRIGLCALQANTESSYDLRSRALGIIVLVDGRAADARASAAHYVDQYRTHAGNHTLVVGVTQTGALSGRGLSVPTARLLQMRSSIPVLEVDVHDKLQMSILLRLVLDRAEASHTQCHAD
jgi:signal recognition particle receptor subunit beta